MRCFLRTFAFVWLLAAAVSLSAIDTHNLEHLRVEKVTVVVEGKETKISPASVVIRLKTKEGSLFSHEDFDQDLKLLAQEFDRLEPNLVVTDGKVNITLKVWPKPIIRHIIWKGNVTVPTDKLAQELDIKENSIFDRLIFNKAFHKLQAFYVKRGYFEAELNYTVVPVEDGVDIVIDITEGRSGKIDEIVFHGLTDKEADELSDLIFTKTYNFFTSWLTNEGINNPEILRHDELTILSYLHNKGYAEAKLETKILSEKEDRIVIDVTIDKGTLYHLGEISISGNSVIATPELVETLPLRPGDIYSPEKLQEAVKALYDLYGGKGYIDAQIVPEAQLQEGKHVYNVHFKIEEGKRYRVGLIKVFGNVRTDTSVVLHETLLTPGEIFDSRLLSKTEERLHNIGYFSNVNVYAVRSSRGEEHNAHFRDVYIEVEERPTTAQFRTFVGFSTTENVSGGFDLTENNFNIKGIPQLFSRGPKALRGGGEFLGMEAVFGTKQLRYTTSWSKPYFMDTPWTVGVDLSKIRNQYASKDYTIRAYNMGLRAEYQLNAFLRAGMTYRLRHSFIQLRGIHRDHRNHELIRESKNGGLISALGPLVSYDSTDHPMRPTQGLRSSLALEYAGLGGDHTFAKASYLNSHFWSPYQYGTFRLRANLQFIRTLGSTHPRDLPLDERFFMGGELSIRGYHFNTVGPKFHDRQHTVRGGPSSVFFSCDYDQYIFKKVDAFVFFDAGNVYFKQLYVGELRYSTGYGIKLRVLGEAPLIIGMGYPLNPGQKADVKRFFISFGTAF